MAYVKKFYPNGGQMFPVKEKKSERGPDFTGTLDLGPDTIDYIIQERDKGNQEISVELSGWKKVASTGTKFMSVSVKKPFVKDPARATVRKRTDADTPF